MNKFDVKYFCSKVPFFVAALLMVHVHAYVGALYSLDMLMLRTIGLRLSDA